MEKSEQSYDFLFDLPPELTDLIFSWYLSHSKWRFHMRRVCKQWMNWINITDFTLGKVFGHEINQIAESFSKYKTQFGLNFAKASTHTTRTNQYEPLSILSNLTSLTIAHQKLTDGRDPTFVSALTNLEHLDIQMISSTTLNALKKLKTLSSVVYTIKDYYSDEPPKTEEIQLDLPFLESAIFTPPHSGGLSSEPVDLPPLLSDATRLTKLVLNKFVDMPKNYLEEFLNLKQLQINAQRKYFYQNFQHSSSVLIKLNVPFPNLESLTTNTEFNFYETHGISIPKLTYLEINPYPDSENRICRANYYQVEELTNLRALKLTDIDEVHDTLDLRRMKELSSLTLARRFRPIFMLDKILNSVNADRLRALTLVGLDHLEAMAPISKFSKLTDLDLSFSYETTPTESVNITPLRNITRLRLYGSKLILNGLSKLGKSLLSLSITSTAPDMEGAEELKYLRHLTFLEVLTPEKKDISGISTLEHLKINGELIYNKDDLRYLTHLSISHPLQDWSDLTHMTSLETFELRSVPLDPPQEILHFMVLKKLKYLILMNSNWHDHYTKLSQLHTLKLVGVYNIPYTTEKMREKMPFYTEYIQPTLFVT